MKNKKIIIRVIILLFIIGIVVTYKLIENSVTNRENYKVNIENISSTPVDTVNLEESLIYEETVSPNENYVSYDEEKVFYTIRVYKKKNNIIVKSSSNCKRYDIDIMIEDEPKNINKLIGNTSIIIFDAPYI